MHDIMIIYFQLYLSRSFFFKPGGELYSKLLFWVKFNNSKGDSRWKVSTQWIGIRWKGCRKSRNLVYRMYNGTKIRKQMQCYL